MPNIDQRTLPDLKEFSLIKLKADCPSIATLEFAGCQNAAEDMSDLQVWSFNFFDFAIHNLDISYKQLFGPIRAFAITPFNFGEWKFQADIALERGSILLRCREFYFFGRIVTERQRPDGAGR